MACDAEVFEFTENDDGLLEKLRISDPNAHRWNLIPRLRRITTKATFTGHRESEEAIQKVAMLKPNFRPQQLNKVSKTVKFTVNEQQYELAYGKLKQIARALDEQLMYLYRISPDSKQVQFFVQKESYDKLTPLRMCKITFCFVGN